MSGHESEQVLILLKELSVLKQTRWVSTRAAQKPSLTWTLILNASRGIAR